MTTYPPTLSDSPVSSDFSESPNTNTSDLALAHAATIKELKALLAEFENVLNATGAEAAAGVAVLRDRARAALERSREVARRTMEAAKGRAVLADQAIHEHPYAAIGIAAGVGLLVGALITRGRCR